MVKRKKSFKRRRPLAITVIAVMIVALFFLRLVQVYDPIMRQHILSAIRVRPIMIGWQLTTLGFTLVTSASYVLMSVIGLIVLIGFLRLRRWSWVLLMAWTGASLTISLVDYFTSNPNYAVMACNVIIAFALNIPEVQRIYKIRKEDETAA